MLERCPFCNGKAEAYSRRVPAKVNYERHGVRCVDVKCPGRTLFIRGSAIEAAEAWNTRTLSVEVQAVMETLEWIADSGIYGKHYQTGSSLVELASKAVKAAKERKVTV